MKKYVGLAYITIAILFTVYSLFWGDYTHRNFSYNLGASIGLGLVWPLKFLAVVFGEWFPSLGKAIGGFIMVAGALAVIIKQNLK